MEKSVKIPTKSKDGIKGFGVIGISLVGVSILLTACLFGGGIWYANQVASGDRGDVRLYEGPSIEGVSPALTSKSPRLIPATSTECSQDVLWEVQNTEMPQVSAQVCGSYVYVGVESWIERAYAHRESWPNYKEYELPGFTAFEFGYGGQAMVINDNRDLAVYIRQTAHFEDNRLLKDSFEDGGSFERFVQRMRV